jgi:hypothetical protein
MEIQVLDYAAIIIVVVGLCISYKIFVTPAMLEERLKKKRILIESECEKIFVTKEEMQIERKKLLEAVASVYLEKAVFEMAQRRIDDKLDNTDKRFDRVDDNIGQVNENVKHLIDLIMEKLAR